MVCMRLDIPFFPNTRKNDSQCFSVSCLSLISYFTDKNLSLEEVDALLHQKKGYWTYTSQLATALHDLGLDVKYFSSADPTPFLEGESYIRDHFPEKAENIIAHTNVPVLISSIAQLVQYKLFQKKVLDAEEMEIHLQQGHGIILLVDANIILGNEGPFQKQAIVLTGYDKLNYFFHHSGADFPTPHLIVPKKRLLDAWNAPGTDHDVIIVYGKRANRR